MDDADPDHNKIQVKLCETGVQLEITQDTDRKGQGYIRMLPMWWTV